MRYLAHMGNRCRLLVCACVVMFMAGCAQRDPLADTGKSGGMLEEDLPGLSIPLEIREYDVLNESGYRGVFFKLSRLPDSIEYSSDSDPARIVLEIRGPTLGDGPEEAFPGGDTLISRVRVAPRPGILWISLDLLGDDVPEYSVHSMADWVMVRVAAPER